MTSTGRLFIGDGEAGGGSGSGAGGGGTSAPYFYDCTWTVTAGTPSGIVLRYEVVLYTGSNPDDPGAQLGGQVWPVVVSQARIVLSQSLPAGVAAQTVKFAIRDVFPWGPGPWTQIGAAVTTTPSNKQLGTTDNLVPNPTSEEGTNVLGVGSNLVVLDATNSYNGDYCRKLDASAANQTDLTGLIPCVYGDSFSFDCWVKGTNSTVALQLVATFYDKTGTSVGTATTKSYTPSTSYQWINGQGLVPSTAVRVRLSAKASTTGASQFLYFDNLSKRRSTRFSHMESDAGFRALNALGNTGATPADRAYYRGNIDPTARGGAPDVTKMSVIRRRWDTANKIGRLDLKIQPTSAADNLDGMRHAKVDWYKQSHQYAVDVTGVNLSVTVGANAVYTRASGSFITDGYANGQTFTAAGFTNGGNNGSFVITATAATTLTCALASQVTEGAAAGRTIKSAPTLTLVDTVNQPMPDRLFLSTTDSNTGNAATSTAQIADSGVSGGVPAAIITLYNVLGPSDSHCFYSDKNAADGTALVDGGTTFPASFNPGGSPPSGGGGGGGGGGGNCPAPWVLVDMAGGEQRAAAEVLVGDLVQTIHAATGTRGIWPVKAVSVSEDEERWDVAFDGLPEPLTFRLHHRFLLVGGGWRQIEELVPGDVVDGDSPRAVLYAQRRDRGPVVAITVDAAASYQTSGLLSSNTKPL